MPHGQIRMIWKLFQAKVTIKKVKYSQMFKTRKEAEEWLTSLIKLYF